MKIVVAFVLFLLSGAQDIPITEEEELQYRRALENEGLFQGDILLTPQQEQARISVVTYTPILWPNGLMYYSVDSSLSKLKPTIVRAIQHIESKTCLRFKESQTAPDRVVMSYKDGCWSMLGKISGTQPLSLGFGCHPFGTVVHEILHAAGMYREHCRTDRDQYVKIYKNNIKPADADQFDKSPARWEKLLTPFDYNSIMIYGKKVVFEKWPENHGSQATLEVRLTDPFAKIKNEPKKTSMGFKKSFINA
uniref:Metalloendopeptidase n=1 Tax=Plectreurys tristis TaxID=33319 RepID=A0A0C4W7Q2_PLETR|nr:astacin-like protein [Plectreurys tristis]